MSYDNSLYLEMKERDYLGAFNRREEKIKSWKWKEE